ncbi:MAG: transglutaminase domain-containing protein [Chromatiales bacterium]|nr:transglutaminase domain-containing protein [Chromatiales bacterium]
MLARTVRVRLAAGTALALLAVAIAVLWEARDPREAVRLRDSLLARIGTPQDFAWTPADVPPTFLRNTAEVPGTLARAADKVVTASDGWTRGLQIAMHLGDAPNRDQPIQRSTADAYRIMFTEGGGYCADFTQVFVGLATAAGVPVREWGLSFDGFGGDGHAVVEVFDERRGKWLMIDPFNSFYPADAATGEPLSVLEFRERLRSPRPLETTRIVRISPRVNEFPVDEKLVEYFRRGIDQFYLWWGTNLFSYEQDPFVAVASRVSRTAEQAVAILRGVHPGIVILPTGTNQELIRAERHQRQRTLTYLITLGVLAVLLVVQLLLLLPGRRRA